MATPRPRAVLAAALLLFASGAGLPAAALADDTQPLPSTKTPETVGKRPAATPVDPANVPLARVFLFSSGVGFFDRQGEIDGDATVALKFNTGDINDLLKSLVLEDRGGGQIAAVTYASKDPITKTLRKFAVDLTANPTLGQILNQIRGQRIEFAAPGAITGTVLGVEKRTHEIAAPQKTVESEILNVLTDEGLRSVPLDQVGTIKILDPQLDKEFRQALAVLALQHDVDKKSVALHFAGQGKRPVRVGYIQNTPIWKTSYRLVLSDDGKPMLQGWAIVENTTEEDWAGVHLTLISGRPISFMMNLYDPLYVQRPTVEPELFAGLRPQLYHQAMDDRDQPDRANMQAESLAAARPAAGTAGGMGGGVRKAMLGQGGRSSAKTVFGTNGFVAGDLYQAVEAKDENAQPATEGDSLREMSAITAAGIDPSINSGDVGELFQYAIVPPVTLARQESAMLPIVGATIEGAKLSVYNPAVQDKHPLCGLRLKNTTDLHLMQGPITVFDGGTYAGDARIEDIAPGGERLLTYSLDLDVEGTSQFKGSPDEIASIRLAKGVMYAERKQVRTRTYKLKNSGDEARHVLVEQPVDAAWTLIEPKTPSEKTRDLYRFAVDIEPGKTAELKVVEEHLINQQIALINSDHSTLHYFLSQKIISPAVKAALENVISMRAKLAQVVNERTALEGELKKINDEQQRIRQNMPQLDRNSDLYKRYVKKLGDQEDVVEKIEKQIERLRQDEAQKTKTLDEYLLSLDLK